MKASIPLRVIETLFDQEEIMNYADFQSDQVGVFVPERLFRDSPWDKALSHHLMTV